MTGPTVCVHGLGRIGLPTAAVLAAAGCEVRGFDPDEAIRTSLSDDIVPTREADVRQLVERTLGDRLRIVDEPVSADYHLLCVPTPLDDDRTADLAAVQAAGRNVAEILRTDDTVVLESTVPPGTTREVLRPILESSGLDARKDFALAYSPETVLPGNTLRELRTNSRIVGVLGTQWAGAVRALYERFVEADIRLLPDPTTAELVKIIQNASRDVRIAFANEVARIARDYGVDPREAIGLANDHPRVEVLSPGPGVGGHCLPVDPWFLTHDSDEVDLIGHARRLNDSMADYVADVVLDQLPPGDAVVALLGVAYKGNVDDPRHSPGLRVAAALQNGAAVPEDVRGREATPSLEVRLHDPHVDGDRHGVDVRPLDEVLEGADVLVVTADHDEYTALNPERVARAVDRRTVVDTKAVLDSEQWLESGFDVERI
jgi:UDP-N-acetyl-D-mannosaminuronic acid dehydrogenase